MPSTAPRFGVAGHKTQAEPSFDAQVAQIAPERDAVFSLAELCSLGISDSSVRARVVAGRLHRVHQGVYALVPLQMLTVRARYRAAVLACTGSRHQAALSHRSRLTCTACVRATAAPWR